MRLSRSDSQAQTRRRLLDSARAIVERDGLAAVTVSRIAADAGMTTGAVYSNFKGGRAELLLAVTQDMAHPVHELLPEQGGAEAWLAGLAAVLGDHTDSPGAVSLATEMMSIALRDGKVTAAGVAMATDSIEGIAAQLAERGEPAARDVAVLAIALFAGLAQYRSLLGPEAVPLELAARGFAALGAVEQSRQGRARA